MSSTQIDTLIDEVQAAFDREPTEIEAGLDVDDSDERAKRELYRGGGRRLYPGSAVRAGYQQLCVQSGFLERGAR